MKGKCHRSDYIEVFLVLFDQHAVHERIRLENNLAGEFNDKQYINKMNLMKGYGLAAASRVLN